MVRRWVHRSVYRSVHRSVYRPEHVPVIGRVLRHLGGWLPHVASAAGRRAREVPRRADLSGHPRCSGTDARPSSKALSFLVSNSDISLSTAALTKIIASSSTNSTG